MGPEVRASHLPKQVLPVSVLGYLLLMMCKCFVTSVLLKMLLPILKNKDEILSYSSSFPIVKFQVIKVKWQGRKDPDTQSSLHLLLF